MSLQIRVCIAIQTQFEKHDKKQIITEEITKGIKIEDNDTDSSNECSVSNIQEVLLAAEHTCWNIHKSVACLIFQHCYICKYQNLQSE
jgi:hypothetical protein